MSADQTDYDKLVKDRLRLRLMESGWTSNLTDYIKYLIAQYSRSNPKSSIKFDRLYQDVILRARLAIPVELEQEFHQSIEEYLSMNFDETSASLDISHNSVAQGPQGIPSSGVPLSTVNIVPSDVVRSSNLTNDPSSAISYNTSNVPLSSSRGNSNVPSFVFCNVDPDINK